MTTETNDCHNQGELVFAPDHQRAFIADSFEADPFVSFVSHCREIPAFRQARNPGKLQNTVHCNCCTVPAGSELAAQAVRRQKPKRDAAGVGDAP
jgi:hypothetical protein